MDDPSLVSAIKAGKDVKLKKTAGKRATLNLNLFLLFFFFLLLLFTSSNEELIALK